jgi:catechol 2,3-dioxygenase-like lactoylglutathione lyase family enzyme
MKINFKRLDHVNVTVPIGGEDAAREFYGNLLGMREIDKPDELKPRGGLWFEVAGIELHVSVEAEWAKTKRHAAFEVDDLDSVREFLNANGVKTIDEETVYGKRRMAVYDPFGNKTELLERV